MIFTRSIKKCDSWVACAYMADKETIGFEHHPDRKVLYQYVYYGSAKIGTPFSSKYRLINQTILFSPSAASFDTFKNFEDRGYYFNQLIKKYTNAK